MTISDKDHYREVLLHNGGFEPIEEWIEYASKSNFQKVSSTKLSACPDCSKRELKKIGQYIYYSSLIPLYNCLNCSLYFSGCELDKNLTDDHFEAAYKDEEYFKVSREPIFSQLLGLFDKVLPINGKIIDIGGARGDLMNSLKEARPDAEPTVQDISNKALEFAKQKFNLKTTNQSLLEIDELQQYDIVSMIDVLYYEKHFSEALNLSLIHI